LTEGRIATTHGWFNGIQQVRQCAPPLNTCFLGPTRVPMPNGISTGSAVCAQLTAESCYTLQLATPFPFKIPLFHRRIWTTI